MQNRTETSTELDEDLDPTSFSMVFNWGAGLGFGGRVFNAP